MMQSEEDQIWDPEHDWILQFERILKPGAGLASKHTLVNLTLFYSFKMLLSVKFQTFSF